MRTTVVVDKGHPADGALEGGTLPEAGTARIFDDDVALVPPRCADEPTANVEKVTETFLFLLVVSTRVIGDRLGGARDAKPEDANNARAEPPFNKTFDSWV